ncbi:hypothetical protein CEXT_248241 [Caerostris extrusa]|uniref:Uncharacterized protein n=1 Tax=Caerostris extrusa TaxID=172846 RepID=A0AAV4XUI3_CAEEX|nr:hypothetical protein CEXT_248241 [Caerostris extrusa]
MTPLCLNPSDLPLSVVELPLVIIGIAVNESQLICWSLFRSIHFHFYQTRFSLPNHPLDSNVFNLLSPQNLAGKMKLIRNEAVLSQVMKQNFLDAHFEELHWENNSYLSANELITIEQFSI